MNDIERSESRPDLAQVRSGNENERLEIRSGKVLLADQFLISRGEEPKLLINLEPGIYGIYRDPHDQLMIVHPAEHAVGSSKDEIDAIRHDLTQGEELGRVRIETRALVFLDPENTEALADYRALFNSGEHKEARDALRAKGGAVRYGFSRTTDVLVAYGTDRALVLVPASFQ